MPANAEGHHLTGAVFYRIGNLHLAAHQLKSDLQGERKGILLVIAPPPIGDGMLTSSVMPIMGLDCPAKSRELAKYYEAQCRLLGVSFLDAGALGCEFNQIDYMHLTRRGHARLADELGKRIPKML